MYAVAANETSKTRGWGAWFTRQGYLLKPAMLAALLTGFFLHFAVLCLGNEFVVQNVVTPAVDKLLAIPITYGAIVSWIVWRRVIHTSRAHRNVYGLLAVYFTLSVPFHLRTYVTGDTGIFTSFPQWYSAALLPWLLALMVYTAQLRFKPAQTPGREAWAARVGFRALESEGGVR